jgi:glutamyl-tRNA reductase
VRFLFDNQLPRALAKLLQNLGHHGVHVLDVEPARAHDLGNLSSLAEIRKAIEKLVPKERAELRQWLDAQDIEESPEFLAGTFKILLRIPCLTRSS